MQAIGSGLSPLLVSLQSPLVSLRPYPPCTAATHGGLMSRSAQCNYIHTCTLQSTNHKCWPLLICSAIIQYGGGSAPSPSQLDRAWTRFSTKIGSITIKWCQHAKEMEKKLHQHNISSKSNIVLCWYRLSLVVIFNCYLKSKYCKMQIILSIILTQYYRP